MLFALAVFTDISGGSGDHSWARVDESPDSRLEPCLWTRIGVPVLFPQKHREVGWTATAEARFTVVRSGLLLPPSIQLCPLPAALLCLALLRATPEVIV